jgi:hypothetical protein
VTARLSSDTSHLVGGERRRLDEALDPGTCDARWFCGCAGKSSSLPVASRAACARVQAASVRSGRGFAGVKAARPGSRVAFVFLAALERQRRRIHVD